MRVNVQVTNLDNLDQPLECDNSDCRLIYRHEYTPILHDVVPNQVYKDHPIDFVINIQAVHNSNVTPADGPPIEELSIDGALVYNIDVLDNDEDDRLAKRLSSYRLDRMPGFVSD